MNTDEFFAGSSLSAEDLRGREHVVEIEEITADEFESEARDGGKYMQRKPILFFVGKDKKLILNKINFETIKASLGQNMDRWIGQSITIYPTTTPFGNKIVPCIRVRGQEPLPAKATTHDPDVTGLEVVDEPPF